MGDEEELDSDLEVDPCSITPPETPSSPVAGPSDGLPRMEEILATLESEWRAKQGQSHGVIMAGTLYVLNLF